MKTILTLSILMASSISLASSSNEVDTFKLRKSNKVGELICLLKDPSENQYFGLYRLLFNLSQLENGTKLILAALKDKEYHETMADARSIKSLHLCIKWTDKEDIIIADLHKSKRKAYISTKGPWHESDPFPSHKHHDSKLYVPTDAKSLQILYAIQPED